MKKISLDSPRARARLAFGLAIGGLVVLGLVFFRTQVLRAGPDVLVQQGNRLRVLPLPAPRGAIVDRDGIVLAGSRSATALVLMPAPRDSMRARVRRIARVLELPDSWRERTEGLAVEATRPLVVTTELGPADVGRLAAHHRELPGVLLEPWPHRTYPSGHVAGPVVGHVGLEPWPPGSGEDLVGASAGRVVGQSGLELAFDSVLAGEPGLRYVEMNDAGGLITDPTQEPHRPARAGDTLRTRIDADLQRTVGELLPARTRAAAVVLAIATGEVLALYSNPPYIPGTTGPEEAPPENAAIALLAEPGAVFQTITAALALESGRIDTERPQAIPCRGGMRYGERYFRCWKADGHGQLALAGAIREACDVYFYQVALRLGLDALIQAGSRLGLGRETGLELPEERAGLFPTDVPELAERLGRPPNPSDALDLAAGHGLNETTLIRMTHAYGALANGGATPAPHLTGQTEETPWRGVDLGRSGADTLFAMVGAVTARGGAGSAAGSAMSPGTRIRGQLSRARQPTGRVRPTGWFVGVAGADGGPDRIAVGVLIERAPSDDAAAAVAGRIADYYLRNGGDAAEPAAPDTANRPSTIASSL